MSYFSSYSTQLLQLYSQPTSLRPTSYIHATGTATATSLLLTVRSPPGRLPSQSLLECLRQQCVFRRSCRYRKYFTLYYFYQLPLYHYHEAELGNRILHIQYFAIFCNICNISIYCSLKRILQYAWYVEANIAILFPRLRYIVILEAKQATIYRYIGDKLEFSISYQLLAASYFFWNSLLRQKIFFFWIFKFQFSNPISNFSNINPEVWRFGIEDGEICGVDAQAQGGSGEIRKAPTT